MKILNLEKIAELEKKYRTSGTAIAALHSMVAIISNSDTIDLIKNSIAVSTLENLGVLEDAPSLGQSENQSKKQLNS